MWFDQLFIPLLIEGLNNMKTGEQQTDARNKCELCNQKMNPTVKIYKNHTRLCKACFQHMEIMPSIVAKCVERLVVGNVL